MMPRQDSLTDQIATMRQLALEAGCYDAVDWLDRKLTLERLAKRHTETAVDFLAGRPELSRTILTVPD